MLTRSFFTCLILLAALSLSLLQFTGSTAAGSALEPSIIAPSAATRLAAVQSNDFAWVEDSVPAGAVTVGTWNWIGPHNTPTPVSGFDAHRDDLAAGVHQHYFYNATERMSVNPGDVLTAYVYLDPASTPTQVMLQWYDVNNSWDHRAYWAASPGTNGIPWGSEGTSSRRYMGQLPPAGQWVRLEVPAAQVGLEGVTVHGMAFTLFDGTATWDRAGKYGTGAPPAPAYRGSHDLADCNVIAGWAQDVNNPSTRLGVSVYDEASGALVATATADLFRQDLVNAGIGDGRYGFSIPTPAALKDGASHSLRVKVTGTNFSLGGTPKVFNSASSGCTNPTPGPTPIGPHEDCGPDPAGGGPCHLLSNLHWAMTGIDGPPPHPNWERRLDWTFNRWRIGSSENWGPIAHAIALWKPAPWPNAAAPQRNATLTEKINWWNTFLKCQMGGTWNGKGCSVPGVTDDLKNLKYLKGSELLANNYDYSVVDAVVAVNYWATKVHPDQTLANNARAFLRATFAMYTLAAGKEWATKRTYYYNVNESEVSNVCHTNSSGGLYYTGPFLALAGMRSTPAHICQDFRGHLLIRALGLVVRAEREQIEQGAVLKYIQDTWPGNSFNENAYALNSSERTALIGHKNSGNATATLLGMLGTARTSTGYNFLGWNDPVGGQVRATLMERNNNHNTVAIYGIKYTQNTHEIHVLFPWQPTTWRAGVSKGKGELRPAGSLNPTTAWATNFNPLDPDEKDFDTSTPATKDPGPQHGVREVSMPLPTSGKLYQIRLRPDGPPQCLSGSGCQ